MAPNPRSIVEPEEPKKLEVLINDSYYDVTEFAARHPGGSVINYYMEKGEDATQAFQQFHNRSTNKVNTILSSLKKRPNLHGAKNNAELTRDFQDLFEEITKEGLFKPSWTHVGVRLAELFILYHIGYVLMVSDYFAVQLLGHCIYGICCGRAGFFMHDLGHKSMTGKPKVDAFLQSFVMGFFNGVSSRWWNRNHNRHHAMPQRLQHDIDLDTMPFIAFNSKVIKDPKQGTSFWIRNQAYLFLSINSFLGVMAWRFYHCPRNAIKRRSYCDLFFMTVHWIHALYYSPFFWSNFLITWVAANYLFGNFSLSHTHTPVTEEPTHWVQYSLTHTVDISHNWLVSWWMGDLNYQIEHHLFPTLPHFRLSRVSQRVKKLAEKHGLEYRVLGYWEAWKITLVNLQNISDKFNKV